MRISSDTLRKGLISHCIKELVVALSEYINIHCSLIDICTPSSSVLVVSSTRCGMGKSFYVRKIKESMQGSDVVCVPMHGPAVTADLIVELLNENTSTSQTCTIYHFEIDPRVSAMCSYAIIYIHVL